QQDAGSTMTSTRRGGRPGAADQCLRSRGGTWGGGADAIDPREECEGDIMSAAPLYGSVQQLPCGVQLSPLECGDAGMQQLFRFTLPLGERRPGPLDVRSRPRVIPIEKERARPHVNRLRIVAREVMIESGQKEVLDFRITIGIVVMTCRRDRLRTKRIR